MKLTRAIILAAGKGVRMNSNIPKVLHALGGKPLIGYVLDLVKSLGISGAYVVLGHQNAVVRKYLPKSFRVVLQKKLLGTADAIRQVQSHFRNYNGDVLVVCADTPFLTKETIRRLIQLHQQSKSVCTVLTSDVDNPQGYGRIVRGAYGDVVAIREEKDAAAREKEIKEINTGVYVFCSRELFKAIGTIRLNAKKKEFYLTDIVELFAENGLKVKALKTSDANEGLGINTREDLALAECVLRYRRLKSLMNAGVTIVDPKTTFIDEDVRIGQDTVIKPFTVIENNVHIGRKCVIGPFCHLRPATRIGNNVEVGNFAEMSRANVGDNCFMKHFSFLGDTTVGNRVNIGAGVVTANFDGKNKNKTFIGDDAFIGSDSILVAPLKIGKKAVTGAGCVVTKNKNIPAGSVAVGVPARIYRRKT